MSKRIDELVHANLKAQGQKPNPIISDSQFLRRAYLMIAGRIPAPSEIATYRKWPKARRRQMLVDNLVGSPGYLSHQFNLWADTLRATSRFSNFAAPGPGENYIRWIKSALAANMPYDEFVRQLIVAEGALYEEGGGAVGYYFRDRGMPLDNMANTSRVFLGTRIECAQCHNHPFDKWTQKQFYELAAYTSMDFRFRGDGMRASPKQRRQFRERLGNDQQLRAIGRSLRSIVNARIQDSGQGAIRLPHDYAYDDGKPGQILAAKPLFGEAKPLQPQPTRAYGFGLDRRLKNRPPDYEPIKSRAVFADWLTSPDNERFTRVIVNRIWLQVMGRALTEPFDDIREDSVAALPELEAYLETVMTTVGYDLQAFHRVLFGTRLFQRRVVSGDVPLEQPFHFAGPLIRRLSAEQMWDSIVTLWSAQPDRRRQPETIGRRVYDYFNDSNTSMLEGFETFVETYGGSRRSVYSMLRLEGAIEDSKLPDSAKDGLRKQFEALEPDDKRGQRRLAKMLVRQHRFRQLEEPIGYGNKMARSMDDMARGGRRGRNALVFRASELPSPAPPNHFIRVYGGSDREMIDAASTEPGTTQALFLLNGWSGELFHNPASELHRYVKAARGTEARVEAIYWAILTRLPTASERRTAMREVERADDAAWSDLIWILLNSHEFKFLI